MAVLSSLALKKIFFRKAEAPFVMELPPYRFPTSRSVVRHMWGKGAQYLRKMGTVILVASVLIWALGYFPRRPAVVAQAGQEQAGSEQVAAGRPEQSRAEQGLAGSYIGRLGRAIEPAIRPLGFDWRIGVSLLSGMAAKEIIVSSMAVLSNPAGDGGASADLAGSAPAGHPEAQRQTLADHLRAQRYASGPRIGQSVYTPLVAYALMIFILLYFPCFATIAAIRKEAGGRWALFTVAYTTLVAWVAAFAIFQIGSLV